MANNQTDRRSEKGNILVLILIAIVLLAAISYFVTQATRTGKISVDADKDVPGVSSLTEYPAGVRTAVIRMVLGGVAPENLKFNAPDKFGNTDENPIGFLVFHPEGGRAKFENAPANLSADGKTSLPWSYNANFQLSGLGGEGAGGNDVIAFLPGVSTEVCKKVNEEAKIDVTSCTAAGLVEGVPKAAGNIKGKIDENMAGNAYIFPKEAVHDLQCAGGTAFTHQTSGCFYDEEGARNVFYSVLMER